MSRTRDFLSFNLCRMKIFETRCNELLDLWLWNFNSKSLPNSEFAVTPVSPNDNIRCYMCRQIAHYSNDTAFPDFVSIFQYHSTVPGWIPHTAGDQKESSNLSKSQSLWTMLLPIKMCNTMCLLMMVQAYFPIVNFIVQLHTSMCPSSLIMVTI